MAISANNVFDALGLPGPNAEAPGTMTPGQIQSMREWAKTLEEPSPGGQSGPYRYYGKWNAMADALRGGLAGYYQYQAGQAEKANIGQAAGAYPQLGNYGNGTGNGSAVQSALGGYEAHPATNPLPSLAQDRQRFAAELEADPQLKNKVFAIAAGENQNPSANLAVMESAMNRASMMGTTLADEMKRTNENGYYAGWNPSALNHAQTRHMMETNLKNALAGSNIANFATDNASDGPTNFATRRIQSGMFNPTAQYAGEYFLHPNGPDARGSGAPYRNWLASVAPKQQQQQQQQRTAMAAPGTATDAAYGSPAPAAAAGQPQPQPQAPAAPMQGNGNMPVPSAALPNGGNAPMQGGGAVPQTGIPAAGPNTGLQGGGAAPQPNGGAAAIPSPGNLPPLPSDEQIQQLAKAGMMTGNPAYSALAQKMWELKFNALQPQQFKTPDGRTLIGNAYQGWRDSGLPAQPEIVSTPEKVGTVETTRKGYLVPQAGGGYAEQPIPQLPVPGQNGAGTQAGAQGGGMEPFPMNGTTSDKAQWGERQQARLEASKEAAKQSGGIQSEIDKDAENALFLKRNMAEMRNLAQNINPNNFADIKRVLGNTLQGLGFSNEAVSGWLGTNPGDTEAFRKASSVLGAELTHTYFPRPSQNEFKVLLSSATPNELMTPQGLGRVLDFSEKAANQALDKQSEFQGWKRGVSPEHWNDFNAHWNAKQRALIEQGALASSPGEVGGRARTGYQPPASPARQSDPLGMR